MKHIAIFASGTGTNARKIVEHFEHKDDFCVSLVVSNNPAAPVLDMAREKGIATFVLNREYFYKSEDILKILNKYSIDFVALAGFLLLVPGYLVRAFEKRMVNIHPALLPKYGGKEMYGMKVHRAVCEAGEKESGITIHYVNEHYDEGSTIFQAKCLLDPGDTPEIIAQKVLQLEHRYFPQVIERLLTHDS